MVGMERHRAEMDDAGEIHAELRPLLFSIAYRMLGSVAEAEDVVQEAYLRWHRALTAGAEVESPKAYLAAVTTRLAIDQLRARKSRREAYVGPWLPEPLVAETEADVAQHAEMAESLSMAFLVLLESLSPVERAVFLLREVFEYGYDEIAQIVDKSEANCRQIFARARPIQVNGQPGGIGLDAKGQVINVIALDIAEGRVRGIRSVVNPDKLGHLGPVSDVARLTRPKRR